MFLEYNYVSVKVFTPSKVADLFLQQKPFFGAWLSCCALFVISSGVFFSGCAKSQDHSVTQTVIRTTEIEVVRPRRGPVSVLSQANLFRLYSPGVVSVFAVIDGEIGEFGDRSRGNGTGFFISGKGEILTTAHAITSKAGQSLREAKSVFVRLYSGEEVPAEIIGIDEVADLALLRVNPARIKLRVLKLENKNQLVTGERLSIIGAPLQDAHTFSAGSVSAQHRLVKTLPGFLFPDAVQTDAPVNLGNSGGPVLRSDGKVVGIATEVKGTQGSGDGVGFFIPAASVHRSLVSLRKHGEVTYPFLGVTAVSVFPTLNTYFHLGVKFGAWIQELAEKSPAEEVGIRAANTDVRETFNGRSYLKGGDVIIKFANKEVRDERQLALALLATKPGDIVNIVVVRDREKKKFRVRIDKRPEAD